AFLQHMPNGGGQIGRGRGGGLGRGHRGGVVDYFSHETSFLLKTGEPLALVYGKRPRLGRRGQREHDLRRRIGLLRRDAPALDEFQHRQEQADQPSAIVRRSEQGTERQRSRRGQSLHDQFHVHINRRLIDNDLLRLKG